MRGEQLCRAGTACRDARIVNGERVPAGAVDNPLCVGCLYELRQAIRKLQADYFAVGEAADERSASELSVSMTPDPSIPINANVLALQDELAIWAEAALTLMGYVLSKPMPKRQKRRGFPVRNAAVINAARQILPGSEEKLAAAPAAHIKVWLQDGMTYEAHELSGVDVALKMMHTHRKVKALLGERGPRRQRLAMPCPMVDCGMPTLGIDNGDDAVTCRSCGGRWTEAEYEWFAGLLLGSINEKEVTVLRWLIAEKTWQNSELREALEKINALACLPADELAAFDSATVTAMLREYLAGIHPDAWQAQKSPAHTNR